MGDNGLPPEPGSTVASAISVSACSEPVLSVWDLGHVQKNQGVTKHDQTWTCLWCNLTFKHWNATKVLYHLAKISGHDVRVCKAAHDKGCRQQYLDMVKGRNDTAKGVKERATDLEEMVDDGQTGLVNYFCSGRRRGSKSGGPSSIVTSTATVAPTIIKNKVPETDLSVETYSASKLTIAIADYVHSTGLPFSVTQGVYFQNILKFARGVPPSYRPPDRNAISTKLLKMNYTRRIEK